MRVFLVWAFTDVLDSVWTEEEPANARDAELRKENGPLAPAVEPIELNTADAWGR